MTNLNEDLTNEKLQIITQEVLNNGKSIQSIANFFSCTHQQISRIVNQTKAGKTYSTFRGGVEKINKEQKNSLRNEIQTTNQLMDSKTRSNLKKLLNDAVRTIAESRGQSSLHWVEKLS